MINNYEEVKTTSRAAIVSEDARTQLEAWGCSDASIEELARIGGRYRYDNCLEKVEAIATRGGSIIRLQDTEGVLLPEFYDFTGDRRNGQCGEIATKIYRDVQEEWLPESGDLTVQWMRGEPRTHFKRQENHFWVGLGKKGVKDIVTLDGSFLEISKQGANGYIMAEGLGVPPSHRGGPDEAIPFGTMIYDSDSLSADIKHASVLGVTRDLAHVALLSFVIDQTNLEGRIYPIIEFRDADKKREAVMLQGSKGALVCDPDRILSSAHIAEGRELVAVLAEMDLRDRF